MAQRPKGFDKRLTVGVYKDESEFIEAGVKGGVADSAGEVIRHYFKKGVSGIIASPSTESRDFPLLAEVPCGTACDLHAVVKDSDIPVRTVRDPEILAVATEHSFIATARGMSMHNQKLPESISNDDELLMVPYDEWPDGLRAGLIVLVQLHMKDGTDLCVLKEWDGRALKANNPTFKRVNYFGPDVESATAMAVCRARLPKVF